MKENIFKSVMMPRIGSSTFDLSHDVKLSFNMGELIPTCVMDVVPGDKFKMGVENMLRFSPLVSPVMHRINVSTHYFFVPNRILWDDWEDWITGEIDNVPPRITAMQNCDEGDLGDYMGVPTDLTSSTGKFFSAFPFAAYCKIWDEYYRDQNLQTEVFVPLVTGTNTDYQTNIAFSPPLKRAWQHDYFTSCLPWAQKGDAVTLPLTENDQIDVELKGVGNTPDPVLFKKRSDHTASTSDPVVSASGEMYINTDESVIDPNGTLEVNINSESVTINTLRRAFRLQEWLEKNARGGTRYIENIYSHFGVKSSDKRLQRPEYIGGSHQKMIISEVLSTAQTVDQSSNDIPIGQMAGHGISVGGGNTWEYTAEEHGWIIGIVNVQPETAYQQGIDKKFLRDDRLDYLWPNFAHIGEQEVLLGELYAKSGNFFNTFGYIPRYSEYRFMNNRVAGEMKTSLDFWHLGRIFSTDPALNDIFIECDPDTRIFADDGTSDTIIAHVFNNIKATRKLPKYAIPSGI